MASAQPPKPTYKQCERWRFSLENALQDPVGFEHFYAFLQEYEYERLKPKGEFTRYLDFWKDTQDFTNSTVSTTESKKEALRIYELYLSPKADKKVGLGVVDDTIIKVKKLIDETEDSDEVDDESKKELLSVFSGVLENMFEYMDEGGCCGAYCEWKTKLKGESKKSSGTKCRLM